MLKPTELELAAIDQLLQLTDLKGIYNDQGTTTFISWQSILDNYDLPIEYADRIERQINEITS